MTDCPACRRQWVAYKTVTQRSKALHTVAFWQIADLNSGSLSIMKVSLKGRVECWIKDAGVKIDLHTPLIWELIIANTFTYF